MTRQVSCKSAEAARCMTERLAATKLGVLAFSMSGDAELGEFDDLSLPKTSSIDFAVENRIGS